MNKADHDTREADLCRQLVEAINSHDADALNRLVHPEYVDVDLSRSKILEDVTSFQGGATALLAAFPDATVQASVAYIRTNRVGLYWMVAATQSSSLLGVPPTFRRVKFCGFSTLRIREGLIAHGLHLWDMAGLLRELRLVADLTDATENFDLAADLSSLVEGQTGGIVGVHRTVAGSGA